MIRRSLSTLEAEVFKNGSEPVDAKAVGDMLERAPS